MLPGKEILGTCECSLQIFKGQSIKKRRGLQKEIRVTDLFNKRTENLRGTGEAALWSSELSSLCCKTRPDPALLLTDIFAARDLAVDGKSNWMIPRVSSLAQPLILGAPRKPLFTALNYTQVPSTTTDPPDKNAHPRKQGIENKALKQSPSGQEVLCM